MRDVRRSLARAVRAPNCEVHFAMIELLESSIAGVNILPTALVVVSMLYWLFVLTGVIGFDLFDFDLDVDADVPDLGDVGDIDTDVDVDVDAAPGGLSSAFSFGAIALKFLNIGRVPLMVWGSVFALAFWSIAVLWDKPVNHETWSQELLILLRNGALAVVAAKLFTQPLRGHFDDIEPQRARDLVGRECSVITPHVTEKSGQARFHTGEAPLLLNVRARGTQLEKGDVAIIVEYDANQGIYYVEKAEESTREVQT